MLARIARCNSIFYRAGMWLDNIDNIETDRTEAAHPRENPNHRCAEQLTTRAPSTGKM